jgi:hypothetical protein
MSKRSGRPPIHGQIVVSTLPKGHAKKHLAAMTASMSEVKDYGNHGTSFSSQGSFSSGGASGADYQTTSVGDTPDSDSAGATGY